MKPEEYLSLWRDLPVPASALELEASEVVNGSGVWVARDAANRQHLLVRLPDSVRLDVAGTHGLSVAVGNHRIAGQRDANYIDLACVDQAVAATFAVVAADIAVAALGAEWDERQTRVVTALNKWRWFWGVDPALLSSADAVGLFGELWFLLRWVGVSADAVRAWSASNGSRHDFQWPDVSVEVKTTVRAGTPVHTIAHLEQLEDAETGQLYLYSLRVARDTLAANTLHSLVEAAAAALSDQPDARSDLLTKLGQRGYSPAGRDHAAVPYRVVEEGLFEVAGDFPRLTRDSFPSGLLPDGVSRVSYQLDVAACGPFRLADRPGAWPPR